MRFIAVLDSLGSALLLQLCCLLCSIPLVTAVPAAIALQAEFEQLRRGGRVGVRSYLARFRLVWRASWPYGLAAPFAAVCAISAVWFWSAAPGALRVTALGGLAFCVGALAAFALALLARAASTVPARASELGAAAWRLLLRLPLRALWALALLVAWAALLTRFPALAVIGSGLVPVAVVSYTMGPRRWGAALAAQASRS